jgi:hypothetical protein
MSAADFDQSFIYMMVPHHESAIAMASIAQQRAEHAEIKSMADDIIAGQGTEQTVAVQRVLPGQQHAGKGPIRMTGDANSVEIKAALEQVVVLVKFPQMVKREAHIKSSIIAVYRIDGPLQGSQRVEAKAPDSLVTPQVLHVHRNQTMAGPMAAKILITFPGTTQPVGKDNYRERTLTVGRKIHSYWHLSLSIGIIPI